jgi:hypothetical protein
MQKILAATAASVLLAACGSPARIQETATSVPQRDLTLSPSVTETQVASKIELALPATTHRSKPFMTVTRARVHVAAKSTVVSPAPAPTPAPELVAPMAAPTPTAIATSSRLDPSSHELAPGATVTIVPVSTASGSPNGAGSDWSEIPSPRPGGGVTIVGWGGGHCGSGGRDHGGRGPVSILQ